MFSSELTLLFYFEFKLTQTIFNYNRISCFEQFQYKTIDCKLDPKSECQPYLGRRLQSHGLFSFAPRQILFLLKINAIFKETGNSFHELSMCERK